MNDRFKFRIFEKETKTMVELDAVGYSSFDPFKEGKSRLIMIPSGLGNTFHYEKQCLYDNEKFSEPMQSTGLKDKNGKLIYEGDILEICEIFKKILYRIKVEIVHDIVRGFVYQGSYVTKGHTLRFVKRSLDYLYDEETNCLDGFYLGSIYENPELLEEQCANQLNKG